MQTAFLALLLAAIASPAIAQISGVDIKAGDLYGQFPNGMRRLTRDGHIVEATLSRDRNLIAYVHKGPHGETGSINDLYLCGATAQVCVLAVHGTEGATTETNLADISNVRFSLQAGESGSGALTGSVFFLSAAGGANTEAIHRVLLGGKTIQQLLNSPPVFITYANSLEIVPSGKFAGALKIEVQQYTTHGACGAMTVFDPNMRKVLQQGPANDC
jgi:hypothetical protein